MANSVKPGQIWKVIESRFLDKQLQQGAEDYYIVIKALTTRYDQPWVDFWYLDYCDVNDTDADDSTSVEWLKLNAELESDVK